MCRSCRSSRCSTSRSSRREDPLVGRDQEVSGGMEADLVRCRGAQGSIGTSASRYEPILPAGPRRQRRWLCPELSLYRRFTRRLVIPLGRRLRANQTGDQASRLEPAHAGHDCRRATTIIDSGGPLRRTGSRATCSMRKPCCSMVCWNDGHSGSAMTHATTAPG